MTTITALPTPPSRSDPVNFAQRGDEFLGALPQFQTETNLVASEINSATTLATSAAATATAAANYKGEYSAGTTYLLGESVSYLSVFYLVKVTSTVGVLPTNTTNWQVINDRGALGASSTGVNISLDATSGGAQNVTTTAYGQKVTLPDATTIRPGTSNYTIMNSGYYDLAVYDFTNTLLGFVRPQTSCEISLSTNLTSAGVWLMVNDYLIGVSAGTTVRFPSSQLGPGWYRVLTGFTGGVSIHLFTTLSGGPGNFDFTAIAYNETTNTWGTPVSIVAGIPQSTFKASLDTVSQFVVFYNTATATVGKTFSVSGTSITLGTTATQATNPLTTLDQSSITGGLIKTGTSYIICDSAKNSTTQRAMGFSVIGASITAGGTVAFTTTNGSMVKMYLFGTTIYIIYASSATAYSISAYSVSGGTLTLVLTSTVVTVTATSGIFRIVPGLTGGTAGGFLFVYATNGPTTGSAIGIFPVAPGTTPTFSASQALLGAAANAQGEITLISGTKVLVTYASNQSVVTGIITFTGTTLSYLPVTYTINGNGGTNLAYAFTTQPTTSTNIYNVVIGELGQNSLRSLQILNVDVSGSSTAPTTSGPRDIPVSYFQNGSSTIDSPVSLLYPTFSDGTQNPLNLVKGTRRSNPSPMRLNLSVSDPRDNIGASQQYNTIFNGPGADYTLEPVPPMLRTVNTFYVQTNPTVNNYIMVSYGSTAARCWVCEVSFYGQVRLSQVELA